MKNVFIASTLIAATLIVGCGPSILPVYRLQNEPFVGSVMTMERSEDRILDALHYRRWSIDDVAPGVITASLFKRDKKTDEIKYGAVIRISYDENSYSIEHVESKDMRYDSEAGIIHNTYNRWVNNLRADLALPPQEQAYKSKHIPFQ